MSKLRADILYDHHLHNSSSMAVLVEDEDFHQNEEVFKFFNESELSEDLVSMKEKDKSDDESDDQTIQEDSDDESDFLEVEFNDYLQGWAEMLEEEEKAILEEENEELLNNYITTGMDDFIHPINCKWKLGTLFKKDLKFPF